MSYFFTLYLTSLGLGFFLSTRLELLFGLLLIPLLLFAGSLGFGLHPSQAAFVVAALAALGWARRIFRLNRFRLRFRSETWMHPVLILPLIYLVYGWVTLKEPYFPSQWDEFSHWLLMPKQMDLFDEVSSLRFPYRRFLEYTPGWPLLLDYPLWILRRPFTSGPMLGAPFLLAVGVCGLLYEVFGTAWASARVQVRIPRRERILCTWVGVLAVAWLGAGIQLYPTHLLIEGPFEAAVSAVVLIVLLTSYRSEDRGSDLRLLVFAGVIFSAGYLFKKSFIFTVPLFSMLVLYQSKRNPLLKRLAWVTGPIVLVWSIWTWKTRAYPALFVALGQNLGKPVGEALVSKESGRLLYGMILETWHLLWLRWELTLLVALGFLLSFREKRYRRVWWGAFFSCLVFFIGLFWLYLSTFPPGEGGVLAAFERYMGTLFKVMEVLAVVLLWIRLGVGIAERSTWFKQILWVLILVLGVGVFSRLSASFEELNQRGGAPRILAEAPALVRLLEQRGLLGRRVRLLVPSDEQIAGFQATYAAIDHPGPESFVPIAGGGILDAGVIWPLVPTVNELTAQERSELQALRLGHCEVPFTSAFWIRRPSGVDYECIPK